MFSVIASVNGVETLVENYDDSLNAVRETLEFWNEYEEAVTFYVKDEVGKILATLIKPGDALERAILIYSNGRVEVMTVTYILDGMGKYLSTDIKRDDVIVERNSILYRV